LGRDRIAARGGPLHDIQSLEQLEEAVWIVDDPAREQLITLLVEDGDL
jgi:hypothetical protein